LLILASVTDPESLPGRVLELAPVRYIGRLSYSLYIWQQPFLQFGHSSSFAQNVSQNVALAFVLAACSYYLVERPMIKKGRRLANQAQKVISNVNVSA
jgi:peptidoglycan/LPS O-acetylase OafA/YrhL